ncbi:hypothetical protein PENNAL_c0183G08612 [Penicillium nalgiovense]|uniref:DUF7136 domain-containing protein n=1 Tax=Penicillium nalgiovense TaxID=60175 RepID=A0A1V6WUS3_PENNA|nr:hypothetical protein PENNAL_c0183G08612 [Penicillium nalgiovense]
MYTFNNKLYLGSLLALQACTKVMGASATSGVLEVDLIFPRNETYAPSAQMPVVFGIQNPRLVAPLNMKVSYIITPPRNYHNISEPGLFNLHSASSSDSDPYFLYNNTDLVNTEGTWELTWFVEYGRCTGSSGDIMFYPSSSTIDSIIFTTEGGAAKPDLIAASKKDTCATVVSNRSPWATANPCAVKFDSAIASNISATLNTTAGDKGSADPKDSKDDKDSDEKDSAADNAGAVHLPVGGVTLLTAVFAGLTYILA